MKKIMYRPVLMGLALAALLISALTATSYPAHAALVPAAPSNLTATAVSATSVQLTWTNNAGNQSGVVISRDGVVSADLQGATVSSYTWIGLSPGTKYWFYIASKIYGTPGDPTGFGNTQSAWVGPVYATTPAQQLPTGTTNQANSGPAAMNWGGYSVNFANPDPQNDPLGASAIWTVPAVNCTQNGSPITNTIAEWVGLGGTTSSNLLEQTGTAQECNNGTASYYPWYEFLGCHTKSQCVAATPNPVHFNDHVYPGDNMAADVVEQGPGYFVTQLWDHGSTAHPSNTWYADAIFDDPSDGNATPLTADWIFEDMHVNKSGGPPLPNYSPAVLFQNCYWTKDGRTNKLGSGQLNAPYEVTTDYTQVASTSPLGADDMSFSVSWRTYG